MQALSAVVEDDRDGPVVDELDLHARPEDPRGDGEAGGAESVAEPLVQGLRDLRPGGVGEARSVPPRRVREQRELAHHEHVASGLGHRAVEPPCLVLKDPQARDPGREPVGASVVVVTGHSEQHEQALSTTGYNLAVHRHGRRGHTLHDRAHLPILGHGSRVPCR